MRASLRPIVALVFVLCLTHGLSAQQSERVPKSKESNEQTAAIEVVIAELSSTDAGPANQADEALIKRVLELESASRLTSIQRVRISVMDQQPSTIQAGQTSAIVTGRSSRGGGFGGASAPGDRGPVSESYSMQNGGTLIRIVPAIKGNVVTMECAVEQTKLGSRRPTPTDGEAASAPPPGNSTLSISSILRIKSGDVAILSSQQSAHGKEGSLTVVFVCAKVTSEAEKPH